MTIDDFRRIALSTPGAEELSGLGYPNFRAERKSFATIEDAAAVIRLTRDQQASFMATAPQMFAPAFDGWGKWGSTIVRLEAADEATLRTALATAWRNVTNLTADAFNAADAKCADVDHDGDIAATDATVADVDVHHAAANVASDVVPARNAAGLHVNVGDVDDAEIADVPDACNGADVVDATEAKGLEDPTDVADAALVKVVAATQIEPPDDLKNVIERLQVYWERQGDVAH
jgi:hypothetical protein